MTLTKNTKFILPSMLFSIVLALAWIELTIGGIIDAFIDLLYGIMLMFLVFASLPFMLIEFFASNFPF